MVERERYIAEGWLRERERRREKEREGETFSLSHRSASGTSVTRVAAPGSPWLNRMFRVVIAAMALVHNTVVFTPETQ
jgi:hypothetical protein